MTDPRPVTDDDILAAWNAFFERSSDYADLPVLQPKPDDRLDNLTLVALRRTIENDRARASSSRK